jgi:hypothetical protein
VPWVTDEPDAGAWDEAIADGRTMFDLRIFDGVIFDVGDPEWAATNPDTGTWTNQ